MPKKNAKAQKSNELDGAEFFAAINLIEKEKGIPKAYMLEKITQALVSAYKRDHEGAGDNVTVEADEEAGTVRMFVKKDVVEEVDNPCTEMSLQMARAKLPHAQLGDVIRIEVRTRDFGRIAAQTARQVIIQGMREAERGMIYDEFSSKEHEILTGVVTRVDPRSGAVSLRIGSGSEATEAFLAPGEQVKGEAYLEGMRLRVYVVEVRRSTKGPQDIHEGGLAGAGLADDGQEFSPVHGEGDAVQCANLALLPLVVDFKEVFYINEHTGALFNSTFRRGSGSR